VLAADASDMIRDRWDDVDDRVASGELRETSLTRIVAGMVKRAMLGSDHEGWETFTETKGPFMRGGSLANPNANLYFTTEDLRILDGTAASGSAFVIDLGANVPEYTRRGYAPG
jgi:hypothetical protein